MEYEKQLDIVLARIKSEMLMRGPQEQESDKQTSVLDKLETALVKQQKLLIEIGDQNRSEQKQEVSLELAALYLHMSIENYFLLTTQ